MCSERRQFYFTRNTGLYRFGVALPFLADALACCQSVLLQQLVSLVARIDRGVCFLVGWIIFDVDIDGAGCGDDFFSFPVRSHLIIIYCSSHTPFHVSPTH